jgi:hypothetical protein
MGTLLLVLALLIVIAVASDPIGSVLLGRRLNSVQVGMSYERAMEITGAPDLVEITEGGKRLCWFYNRYSLFFREIERWSLEIDEAGRVSSVKRYFCD